MTFGPYGHPDGTAADWVDYSAKQAERRLHDRMVELEKQMIPGATVRKPKDPPRGRLTEAVVRRWTERDVLFAETYFSRMAFVVTNDADKLGTTGWHRAGQDDQVYVEYISPTSAEAWKTEEIKP